MISNYYAKGRMPQGCMNRTESKYGAYLENLRALGVVTWYKFEAIKLRIGDSCFFTPDFSVLLADGFMEMHEVKGSKKLFMDDAKVKIKVAAGLYPFKFIVVFPHESGSGWDVLDVSGWDTSQPLSDQYQTKFFNTREDY